VVAIDSGATYLLGERSSERVLALLLFRVAGDDDVGAVAVQAARPNEFATLRLQALQTCRASANVRRPVIRM
jgi:hypothetical protein